MNDFERIWDECWTRVTRGELTIEECLARYPKYADELRRLFAVAAELDEGRLVRAKPEYKARARVELIAQIRLRPRVQAAPRSPVRSQWRIIPLAIRVGVALVVLVLLLLVSGTMLAQAALPGDALYGWKIGSEDVFRSIYPDPVAADLALTNRRADELTQVVGTPAAERLAEQEYNRLLSDLPRHNKPSSDGKIREQLTAQKVRLQRAGVNVPAIDEALGNLSAAPPLTATPTTTASAVQPAPTLSASATPSISPSTVSRPAPSPSATLARTRRFTRTPSSTRTPPQSEIQSPTLESDGTARPTRRAKPTETPSATPCATRSPARTFPGEPCATATPDLCKDNSLAPTCETPSRTPSPTIASTPETRSPTPAATPSQTQTDTPHIMISNPDVASFGE